MKSEYQNRNQLTQTETQTYARNTCIKHYLNLTNINLNKVYRPNAHLLDIVMHYHGNTILHYYYKKLEQTFPSIGGTTI